MMKRLLVATALACLCFVGSAQAQNKARVCYEETQSDGSILCRPVSASFPLPTSATVDTTGLATSTKQDLTNTKLDTLHTDATSAIPAGTNLIGKVKINDGTNDHLFDPCQTVAKTSTAISQTANTKIFSQASSKKNYICSIFLIGADAENISLVEGTGSTCGTSTAAIIGGTSAANGPNLAANGGFTHGNGQGVIAAGANNNFDVCLFQSGSGRVAGVITWVQQ